MNEFEKLQWLKDMMAQLQGGGGDLGFDAKVPQAYGTLAERFAPGKVNVGAGGMGASTELLQEAGIGSGFGGTAAGSGLPMEAIKGQLTPGGMSEEEIAALEAMLAARMNALNTGRR